jgi:hypothetical protein
MGYYLSLGRPAGAVPPTLDEIQDALDRRPWIQQDPVDPTDPHRDEEHKVEGCYLWPGGTLQRCDEPPRSGRLTAPWVLARTSWGMEGGALRQVVVVLLEVAGELGMHLLREDGVRVQPDRLEGVLAEHQRGKRIVVGLFGSIETAQLGGSDDRRLLDRLAAECEVPCRSAIGHLLPGQRLAELPWSARTANVLRRAGLGTIAEVASLGEAEFLALPRSSEGVLAEVAATLGVAGLVFKGRRTGLPRIRPC